MAFEPGESRAGGEPKRVALTFADSFGNPVTGATVEIVASRGKAEAIEELGGGRYVFRYAVQRTEAEGEARIEARVQSGKVTLAKNIAVLPYVAAVEIAAGALVKAHSNFALATGVSPAIEVAVRKPSLRLPIEGLARAGTSFYAPATNSLAHSGGAQAAGTGIGGPWFELGARHARPIRISANGHVSPLAVHVAAAAGVRATSSEVRVTGGAVGETPRALETTWHPQLSVGAGATYRLGPGRLVGELQYTYAQATGQLVGNVGGLGLSVGYLVDIVQ